VAVAKEKKSLKWNTRSRHITNLKQSTFSCDIFEFY